MNGLQFDWAAIAGPLLGAGSTALGTLIGGPAGAMIGNAVGPILADALGVSPTPAAVAEAIAANPDAARQAETSHAAELQAAIEGALTDRLRIVNETARLELQSEHWVVRSWRPAFGWAMCLVWTVHGLAIGLAMFRREFDVIARIPDLTMFYMTAGAVVGVTAWGRTREKIAGVAPGASAIIGGLAGGLINKAKGR